MRDRVATLLVGAALVVYVAWATGAVDGLRAPLAAVLILALGFLASASAVVPGFAELLRGSRSYLVATSLVGLLALAAGVLTVVDATGTTLSILAVATLALWAGATMRHTAAERGALRPPHGS